MRSPFQIILFVVFFTLLIVIIQVEILSIAFGKLGLTRDSAMILFMTSLFGSMVNVPLFKINSEAPEDNSEQKQLFRLLKLPELPFDGKTVIAVNLGGCLIPLTFCVYLLSSVSLNPVAVLIAVTVVSMVCYFFSRPLPGLGIGMPVLIAPLTAAIVAILIGGENSAPLAYICGTLGVLLGADVLRMKDIRYMGVPFASIGGAGTFDGVFITGIVAVLLA